MMNEKNLDTYRMDDDNVENVTGGDDWDSGGSTAAGWNYYVFDQNGKVIDDKYWRTDAIELAREHGGFIVGGPDVKGSGKDATLDNWVYAYFHYCIYATDAMQKAHPDMKPGYKKH